MYIIASYFGLQLFSLSHKQLMGGSGATLIWSEPLPLPCIGPQPAPVVLYSLPTHRDISSSLVYNQIPTLLLRLDSSVVRASPRIGKVLGSNPRLVNSFP